MEKIIHRQRQTTEEIRLASLQAKSRRQKAELGREDRARVGDMPDVGDDLYEYGAGEECLSLRRNGHI